MKKRYFLLILVMFITFTGGFIAGISYDSVNQDEHLSTENLTTSDKKPEQKTTSDLEQVPEQSKVLIGYVQDYRNPNEVDYEKLTHVIFSFAHPSKDGRLLMNGDWAVQNLRTMVTIAHQHDTKVILAIGGWFHISGGESYSYFKAAISNPTSRTKLVNELAGMAEREKLDGIDIDFEHPRTKEDAKNLTAFTKALYNKLHVKNKELSIAVNAKVHSVSGTEVNNVIYEPAMFKYVNHVNIMAYDGQWDGEYNAANLSPYSYTANIVNYWSNLFDTHKISKEKLVLGVPFYAQPEDPSIKQISYETIIEQNPANAARDTINFKGTTYHYNGKITMEKKTALALKHGFGGMMIWELGHDSKGPHSLTSTLSALIENANLYATNQEN
jgi:chitinase